MRQALRAVYGRLLMIPAVGPMFRIPVLTWRALRGTQTGAGLLPGSRADTLALTVATLDGLRDEAARLAHRSDLLAAAVEGLRDELGAIAQRLEAADSWLGEQVGTAARRLDAAEARLGAEVGALAQRLQAAEGRLGERIEFARNEAMFELRARLPGGGAPAVPGQSGAVPVEKHVIAADKVAAQRAAGGLRLNLGCGHVPLEGYVNVDMRALPGVDVVAEAADLPFEPASVAEIHSAHLLEHFPLEHLRRVVLPHWRLLLRPGGELSAIVPDAEAMLQDHAQGEMTFDDLREVTYGLQEYDGDFHFNMFSREQLERLLREAGFGQVAFDFQGRRNGKCRDMRIRAVRS